MLRKKWLFDFCEALACVSGKRQCAICVMDFKNKKCGLAKNKTLSGRLAWSAVIPLGLSFLSLYVVLSIFMSLSFFRLACNVRRYVALAQSRGGACFCTRGAMQGYDVVLFIVALAKTVTPGGGPRRQPGQAAPQTT